MRTKMKSMLAIIAMALIFTNCKKEETKPKEETPSYSNFKINTVKITAMSFVDGSGAGWDVSNGPDLFFKIKDSGLNVLFDGSGSVQNDVTTLPVSWTFTNAYQITNLSATRFIHIYDFDTPDPDDFIQLVGFTMSDYTSDYPTTMSKTNGSLSVTITGTWY